MVLAAGCVAEITRSIQRNRLSATGVPRTVQRVGICALPLSPAGRCAACSVRRRRPATGRAAGWLQGRRARVRRAASRRWHCRRYRATCLRHHRNAHHDEAAPAWRAEAMLKLAAAPADAVWMPTRAPLRATPRHSNRRRDTMRGAVRRRGRRESMTTWRRRAAAVLVSGIDGRARPRSAGTSVPWPPPAPAPPRRSPAAGRAALRAQQAVDDLDPVFTGVAVPLCRCVRQPMLADRIIAGAPASRLASLRAFKASGDFRIEHRIGAGRPAAQVRFGPTGHQFVAGIGEDAFGMPARTCWPCCRVQGG